ncbi:MAG: Pesticin receptor [Stenotrophomonas maltophilia]|nr:MAG: Pesticin receptor [Stenotrophomonas maltophilia]
MGKNQYRTRDVAFWGALSALAVPALTLPGYALAADTATASTTGNGEQLDTVVVTAQRKQESAQKIGVAVTPLSGDELTKRGVTSINQLGSEVPSLEIQSPYGNGTPNFRIRGIGFSDYVDNVSPAVGVYVDEVAQPIVSMTQGALFDLERVEVLRGPQGTLYGRNTTGGAINFITKKPTDKFEGNFTTNYESYNDVRTQGYVSGPLNDKLRGRLSWFTEDGGAWQKNVNTGQKLGDKDMKYFRGQLEWDATDNLLVSLQAHYGRDKSEVNL